jgi:Tim10/DDP family zinc finger
VFVVELFVWNQALISVFFKGDRLDTKEQACLASCQDRYFDVRAAVQDAIHKRQEKGM